MVNDKTTQAFEFPDAINSAGIGAAEGDLEGVVVAYTTQSMPFDVVTDGNRTRGRGDVED